MTFTPLLGSEFDAMRCDYSAGATGHAGIHNETNRAIKTLHDLVSVSAIPVTAPDFGADSTGSIDSTDAIQDAIDSHGDIYIPYGTYKISTLTIPDRTVIRAHPRALLHVYGNGSDPAILMAGKHIKLMGVRQKIISGSVPACILSEGGATNITLEDVECDGNWLAAHVIALGGGGNAYWNFVRGDYAHTNGNVIDLNTGGAAFNWWGGRYHFCGGYILLQHGAGNTITVAMQMTGTVLEGGIAGQMFVNSLHGAVFTQCHFENSSNATCVPIKIGSAGADGGQCMGVTFTGCNVNAENAPYCISLEGQGVNKGIVVQGSRLNGNQGYMEAAINAKRVWQSSFVANRVWREDVPHVLMTGDGYSAQNVVVQDEASFTAHNLP